MSLIIGCFKSKMFQFTHPGRGATYGVDVPRGRGEVSIHAPREGCDSTRSIRAIYAIEFQFTHPGRGATPFLYIRLI